MYGSSDNLKVVACRETGMKDRAEDARLTQEYLDSIIGFNLLNEEEKDDFKRRAGFSSLETMYQNVKEAFESENKIIYISISGANYYRLLAGENPIPDNDGGRGMAITKMTNEYVILVDSNKPDNPIKMKSKDFIRVCTVYSDKV